MNAMRMFIALVWLSGLLPGMAQASDADRFVAASRSQQADLLTQWAAAPDAARLPLLEALQKENLYTDSKSTPLRSAMATSSRWVTVRRQKGQPKPCA
jgi:urea transport system permease protein